MNSTQRKNIKTGRNEPCPCGSHIKHKKCCLKNNGDAHLNKIEMIQTGLKKTANEILGGDEEILFVSPGEKLIKMSEIIIDFADEFLQKAETDTQKKRVLELACLAWNLGIFAEKNKKLPDFDEIIESIETRDNEMAEVLKYILSVMVNKKLTEYSSVDRVIVSYKITEEEDFRIDIMSAISEKEMSMTKVNPMQLERL